jgi:quinol monooxygenase YgiN
MEHPTIAEELSTPNRYHPMITVLSRFKAKDAAASELLQLLLELKEQALLERGCVRYELFGTAEDSTVFYVKDSWASPTDVDLHVQQLKSNGYLDRSVALLAEPQTAVTLTEL